MKFGGLQAIIQLHSNFDQMQAVGMVINVKQDTYDNYHLEAASLGKAWLLGIRDTPDISLSQIEEFVYYDNISIALDD